MAQVLPVVINLSSGSSMDQDAVERLSDTFRRAGLNIRMRAVESEEMAEAVSRAAEEAPGMMVVGGGDGTLSHAAGTAHERGLTLGILPTGTLNHFAKDLGLPLDLEEAVEVIARGNKRRVDLGEVNGRLFLNNLSLGIYPRAVKEREKTPWLEWLGRLVGTGWALGKALAHSPRERVGLEAQGESTEIHSHLIFIGNNRYLSSGGSPASRERLDEGGLDIFWAPSTGIWGLIKAVASANTTSYSLRDGNSCWTEEARITSRKPRLKAVCDGEVLELDTPLELACRAGALEVTAP